MEVKVYVEGVHRIVCGVTEKTTCQEVVIALAQALGRTGRYTLREKFKEYERNVTPDERLLEALEKYGEQAKEVQLTLKHIGPSLGEETNQPKAQMRRAEGTGRTRRGSGAIAQHRQSLPPLSRLCLHSEPPPEEPKRPKRKSLTLMEEAWGWLENLGRGGKQQSGRDKGKDKEGKKGNGHSDNTSLKPTKCSLASGTRQARDKKDKNRVAPHQPLISCLGNRGRCTDESAVCERQEEEEQKGTEEDLKTLNPVVPLVQTSHQETESEEIVELRRLVVQQQASLQELKLKIESTDQLILELEQQQATRDFSKQLSEEEEQLKFWLNELKAEEVFERDLQRQFFWIKEEAAECKAKLEEYKQKLQAMDLRNSQQQTEHENITGENIQADAPKPAQKTVKQIQISADGSHGDGGTKRVVTMLESKLPYVLVSANQISNPPLSRPEDLRAWWTRWSQSQNPTSVTKPKIVHRSEITVQLGSTRV
ncbi:ras association domain-containing protein 8 [Sinocyclocheilus anshuiensis]|uniref:ras association domain-containing protein 8 n=1 Tax=Sinocyclocheilus anshuiensis TaxID=1608454 RepID=UPI0007B7FC74|nr:PREDICTED: ras association domain-containing protein 8-like [Sinocyclocheilus anshuiensis]